MRRLLVSMVVLTTSCVTSTSYTPKRTDHAQLVLQDHRLYLHHKGKTIPADQSVPLDFFGTMHHQSFFGCDTRAEGYYDRAQDHFQLASNFSWIDNIFDFVTCGCGRTSCLSPLNSSMLNFEHYSRMHGRALAVDAINRFNDTAVCTGAPPSPAAAAPSDDATADDATSDDAPADDAPPSAGGES